jgi:hypothetical protein
MSQRQWKMSLLLSLSPPKVVAAGGQKAVIIRLERETLIFMVDETLITKPLRFSFHTTFLRTPIVRFVMVVLLQHFALV